MNYSLGTHWYSLGSVDGPEWTILSITLNVSKLCVEVTTRKFRVETLYVLKSLEER